MKQFQFNSLKRVVAGGCVAIALTATSAHAAVIVDQTPDSTNQLLVSSTEFATFGFPAILDDFTLSADAVLDQIMFSTFEVTSLTAITRSDNLTVSIYEQVGFDIASPLFTLSSATGPGQSISKTAGANNTFMHMLDLPNLALSASDYFVFIGGNSNNTFVGGPAPAGLVGSSAGNGEAFQYSPLTGMLQTIPNVDVAFSLRSVDTTPPVTPVNAPAGLAVLLIGSVGVMAARRSK